MKKLIKTIFCIALAMCAVACSSVTGSDGESPTIVPNKNLWLNRFSVDVVENETVFTIHWEIPMDITPSGYNIYPNFTITYDVECAEYSAHGVANSFNPAEDVYIGYYSNGKESTYQATVSGTFHVGYVVKAHELTCNIIVKNISGHILDNNFVEWNGNVSFGFKDRTYPEYGE